MSPRERILEPYTRRVNDIPHKLRKMLAVSAVLLLAVIIGFLVAVLPVQFIVIPILPLVVFLLLVLWMAPDIDPALDRPVRVLFVAYCALALTWPHYIAFVLPGVGFITPPRLTLLLLVPVFIYFVSTSSRARGLIGAGLDAAPLAKWAFIGFVAWQAALTIVTASFDSLWFLSQVNWYLFFLIAILAFSYEGVSKQFHIAISMGIAVVCVMAFWEYRAMAKFWMDWVPEWLRGDPWLWNKIYEGAMRAGTDRYRGSGILLTSVTVGEFIAMMAPFVVLLFMRARSWWKIGVGLLLLFVMAIGAHGAGSRTAFAGLIAGMAVYAILWTIRRYARSGRERDLLGPAAVWAYPVVIALTVFSVLFVGRVRRMVLGGGEHKASDDGRAEQWDRALALFEKNPIGYGSNRAGELIDFRAPGRENVTVDGFYMNLLVDYGVLGFLLFLLFFLGCAWAAARTYLRAETFEEDAGAALASSLIAFLTAKMVLSQIENHYFAFALAGASLAIAARQQARRRTLAGAAPPLFAPAGPALARPLFRPGLARLPRA
ncbi:O-antigen ligase family protein [Thermaurantiacus sp.]